MWNRSVKENNLQRSLGLFRKIPNNCKSSLYQNWPLPCHSSLEKWCWLCCGRNLLLPTLLCNRRNGPTSQPIDLPSVLPQIQRFGQHWAYWKTLLWLCHDRHPSLQQTELVHFLQRRVYWIQLSLVNLGAQNWSKRDYFHRRHLGWRRKPRTLCLVLHPWALIR
jgi:hypothetical protein